MSSSSKPARAQRRGFSVRQVRELRRIVRRRCRAVRSPVPQGWLPKIVGEIERLSGRDFDRAERWAESMFAGLSKGARRRVDRELAAGAGRRSRGAA